MNHPSLEDQQRSIEARKLAQTLHQSKQYAEGTLLLPHNWLMMMGQWHLANTDALSFGNCSAAETYKKAAAYDPTNVTNWTRLSAVQFQLGEYNKALESIRKAIKLAEESASDLPEIQKVLTRMMKCFLLLKNTSAARAATRQHTIEDEMCLLSLKDAENNEALYPSGKDTAAAAGSGGAKGRSVATLRKQIVDHVPRYKPTL